jgi:hypothetical protein
MQIADPVGLDVVTHALNSIWRPWAKHSREAFPLEAVVASGNGPDKDGNSFQRGGGRSGVARGQRQGG